MKYTEIAKDAPYCMGCRSFSDGTLVLAHRNRNGWGLYAGKGVKGVSIGGAVLCAECHAYGDAQGRTDHDFWELAVQRTLTWAFERGFLVMGKDTGTPDIRLR